MKALPAIFSTGMIIGLVTDWVSWVDQQKIEEVGAHVLLLLAQKAQHCINMQWDPWKEDGTKQIIGDVVSWYTFTYGKRIDWIFLIARDSHWSIYIIDENSGRSYVDGTINQSFTFVEGKSQGVPINKKLEKLYGLSLRALLENCEPYPSWGKAII